MTSARLPRRLTALLALVLAVSLLPLAAASAQSDRTVVDLDLTAADVSDAVETSILYSRLTFGSAEQAIIATSADGADALASGALQSGAGGGGAAATDVDGTAITGRPLLFVDPQVGPEQALIEELQRLGVSSLIILGGESAVPPSVVTALADAGFSDVDRLGGATRVETAVLVATFVRTDATGTTAYLSRAFGDTNRDTAFADSTALGAWAASTGTPILLTESEELSPATETYLRSSGIDTVTIIGGPVAVSEDVQQAVTDLDITVTRVAGETRDQTAVAIAEARGFATAAAAERVVVTEGFASGFFVDGFAAAAYAGLNDAAVLLSNGAQLSPATVTYLEGANFAIAASGEVGVCGTPLSTALCAAVASELGATVRTVTLEEAPDPAPSVAPQVGDFVVSPREDTRVQVPIGEDRDDDQLTFTASGLDPDTSYRVTLVLAENIDIDGDQATFVDEDGDGIADPGASEEIALITEVNGTAVETPSRTVPDADDDPAAPTGVSPDAEGDLTVTVDAVEDSPGGSVHVVVYVNGGESTFLEIDEAGAPTEAYGVSGAFIANAVVGDLAVAGHEPQTVMVNAVTGADSENDQRTYTVTGLTDGVAYRITLVPAANITFTDSDSQATFVEAQDANGMGTGVADSTGGERVATIVSVNGRAVTPEQTAGGGRTVPGAEDGPENPTGILPVNGVITFVIDGTDSTLAQANPGGTIRPVVYVNGGASTFLEIDDDGAPTEVYGVGGAFTTTPLPSPPGQ